MYTFCNWLSDGPFCFNVCMAVAYSGIINSLSSVFIPVPLSGDIGDKFDGLFMCVVWLFCLFVCLCCIIYPGKALDIECISVTIKAIVVCVYLQLVLFLLYMCCCVVKRVNMNTFCWTKVDRALSNIAILLQGPLSEASFIVTCVPVSVRISQMHNKFTTWIPFISPLFLASYWNVRTSVGRKVSGERDW